MTFALKTAVGIGAIVLLAIVTGGMFFPYWGLHPDLFCNYRSPIDKAETVIAEQKDALVSMQRVPKVTLYHHPRHPDYRMDYRHVRILAVRLHARVADIYLDTRYELDAGDFSYAQIWRDVYGRHHGASDPCVLLNAHSATGIVTRQPCCYNPL